MKKAITVILAIFLILSLAACANETVNSPEPTGSPSEAPTPEPTDAPTEAPTPTPTATIAVTEEPTATPEPDTNVLSFEECAQEVLRLVPYYVEDPYYTLPEDAPDDSVRYAIIDAADRGPEIFAVYDNLVVVGTKSGGYFDLKIFDIAAHKDYSFVRRITIKDHPYGVGVGTDVAVFHGNLLYTEYRVLNLETGELLYETTTTYSNPATTNSYASGAQLYYNGEHSFPALIVHESMGKEADYMEEYEFYQLDETFHVWHKTETICRIVSTADDSQTTLMLNNGKEVVLPGHGYAVIGKSAEGDLFLNYMMEGRYRLLRITQDGHIASEVEIPYDSEDFWDSKMLFQLGKDGAVYAAASLKDAYIVWRIDL